MSHSKHTTTHPKTADSSAGHATDTKTHMPDSTEAKPSTRRDVERRVPHSSPLQRELDQFITPEDVAAGFMTKKRAEEIMWEWRLWRTGGR
jgi:hypothetical protein